MTNRRRWAILATLAVVPLLALLAACNPATQGTAEAPVVPAEEAITEPPEGSVLEPPEETAQTPEPTGEGGGEAKTTPQPPELPCKDPAGLFPQGRYTETLIAYVNLLKATPTLECAQRGIVDTVRKMVADGCDKSSGIAGMNIKAVMIALGLDTTAEALCGSESKPLYDNDYLSVRILVDLGHKDAARQKLKEGIREDLCEKYGPDDHESWRRRQGSCKFEDKLDKWQEEWKGKEEEKGEKEQEWEWKDLAYLLDPFDVARILADMENHEAARKEIEWVVAKDPAAKIPDDLQYLFVGDLSKPQNLFKNGLYWQAVVAVWQISPLAVIVGAVILVLLLPIGAIVLKQGIHLYRNVVGSIRGAKLDVGQFEGKLGAGDAKSIATLVEETVIKLTLEADRPLVHVVSGTINALENVPETAKAVLPQPVKVLVEVANWLLPQQVITLTGYLHPPGSRGVGLTLALVEKKGGQIIDQCTMWQKDYGDSVEKPKSQSEPQQLPGADAYYRLAKPAAVWTLYKFNNHKLKGGKRFELLGAEDWRGYAAFLAGVTWRLEGQDEKARKNARRMFVEALNRDPDNRGALLNLGTMDAEAGASDPGGSNDDYKRALERLWGAQKASKNRWMETGDTSGVIHEDPVWYKATYQLAAVYSYIYAVETAKQPLTTANRGLAVAGRLARQLVKAVEQTKQLIKPDKGIEKKLHTFLEQFEPLAVTLWASVLREQQAQDAECDEKMHAIIDQKLRQTYRVRYNLACYESIAGRLEEIEKKEKEARERYKAAIDHLGYAFERGGDIVRWAQHDPTLRGIRESKLRVAKGLETTFADQFQKLQKKAEDGPKPEEPLPLGNILAIGKAHAEKLKELGIISIDDLLKREKSAGFPGEMANHLGVAPEFIQQWVKLAHMTRVIGIEICHVNLLEAAQITSLDLLAKEDKRTLPRKLKVVNDARNLVTPLPKEEDIEWWIDQASDLTQPAKTLIAPF